MLNTLYVWDRLIRLFHWLLVAAFTLAYFTGDEESSVHVYAGYAILGLLGFRLVWGLVGSRYARFTSFSLAPSAVFAYLKGLFSRKPSIKYPGHNPAGSWMVIFLLISLTLTGISGLKVYGEEGHGPLAQQGKPETMHAINTLQAVAAVERGDEDEGEDVWEEIHEIFANLTVLLILLHIGGVLLSSRKHNENLVKAMITGYKSKS